MVRGPFREEGKGRGKLIKRDALDAVFSDCVRERAGWRCEYSGTGPDSHLECAHIYGRRKKSVRWHPMNAVCLSHASHRYFTENPVIFAQWCHARFGADHMYQLAMKAAAPTKFTPRELAGLRVHYFTELARMEMARQNGRGGRIEFFFPDPIPEAAPRKKAKKRRVSKFKRKINGRVVLRDSNLKNDRAA